MSPFSYMYGIYFSSFTPCYPHLSPILLLLQPLLLVNGYPSYVHLFVCADTLSLMRVACKREGWRLFAGAWTELYSSEESDGLHGFSKRLAPHAHKHIRQCCRQTSLCLLSSHFFICIRMNTLDVLQSGIFFFYESHAGISYMVCLW